MPLSNTLTELLIYIHWLNCQNPQFMIPCSKLCPRIKLQTMVCYTIKVSILKPMDETNPSLQVKEQKLDTLETTAHTESMLLRRRQNGYRQFPTYIRVTFLKLYVTQNALKSELTSPLLIYHASSSAMYTFLQCGCAHL